MSRLLSEVTLCNYLLTCPSIGALLSLRHGGREGGPTRTVRKVAGCGEKGTKIKGMDKSPFPKGVLATDREGRPSTESLLLKKEEESDENSDSYCRISQVHSCPFFTIMSRFVTVLTNAWFKLMFFSSSFSL